MGGGGGCGGTCGGGGGGRGSRDGWGGRDEKGVLFAALVFGKVISQQRFHKFSRWAPMVRLTWRRVLRTNFFFPCSPKNLPKAFGITPRAPKVGSNNFISVPTHTFPSHCRAVRQGNHQGRDVKFVLIPLLITSKRVEGSLFKASTAAGHW